MSLSCFGASPLLEPASVLVSGVVLPFELGRLGLSRPFGLRIVGDGSEYGPEDDRLLSIKPEPFMVEMLGHPRTCITLYRAPGEGGIQNEQRW